MVNKPFLRTIYNYDRNAASDETGLDCSVEPSLTKQAFKEECDINTIIERFGLGYQLPEGGITNPVWGQDWTDAVPDFHTAVNKIAQAGEAFDALPAHVRARFHHDPGELVDFVSQKSNLEEARKLGLVPPAPIVKEETPPTPAPAASAAPAAPGGPAQQKGGGVT